MIFESKTQYINTIKNSGASSELQKAILKNNRFYRGYIINKTSQGFKIINSIFNDSRCIAVNLSTAKKWVDMEIIELNA